MIYVIRAGNSGKVKIGFSKDDPRKRLKDLQTGSPQVLQLVGYVPGDITLEKELHSQFSHLHIRGEWFRESPEIIGLVTILEDVVPGEYGQVRLAENRGDEFAGLTGYYDDDEFSPYKRLCSEGECACEECDGEDLAIVYPDFGKGYILVPYGWLNRVPGWDTF